LTEEAQRDTYCRFATRGFDKVAHMGCLDICGINAATTWNNACRRRNIALMDFLNGKLEVLP